MFELPITWEQLPPEPEKKRLVLDVENGATWGWGPNGYTRSWAFMCSRSPLDDPYEMRTSILDPRDREQSRESLARIIEEVEAVDVIVGHNLKHDLGLLRDMAHALHLEVPAVKAVEDTYDAIPAKSTVRARSLEDECLHHGCPYPKIHMPTHTWLEVWLHWDPVALELARERCEGDVRMTAWLYRKQRELGWFA